VGGLGPDGRALAVDTHRSPPTAGTTDSFRRHFAQTRRSRFTGGDAIAPTVPVRVVWGDVDHIAKAGQVVDAALAISV
jgi:hypothetical protein